MWALSIYDSGLCDCVNGDESRTMRQMRVDGSWSAYQRQRNDMVRYGTIRGGSISWYMHLQRKGRFKHLYFHVRFSAWRKVMQRGWGNIDRVRMLQYSNSVETCRKVVSREFRIRRHLFPCHPDGRRQASQN